MQQITDTEVMPLGWLEKPVHDEPAATPQEEVEANLTEMRRNVAVCLSVPVLQLLRTSEPGWEQAAEVALPHMIRCDRCRIQLRQSLKLSRAPAEHPAYGLVHDAEEAIRWEVAARVATETAQQRLLAERIGYAYEREGVVYRRLPDGREEVVDSPEPPAA